LVSAHDLGKVGSGDVRTSVFEWARWHGHGH
jgi:hypothetical protein